MASASMLQYEIFLILVPIASVAVILTAFYTWQNREKTTAQALFIALMLILGFLICNTLELILPSPQGTLFFTKANYIFVSLIPVAWLVFALEYNGERTLNSKFRMAALLIIPLLTIFFVLTNDHLRFLWQSYYFLPIRNWLEIRVTAYGGWFWIHVTYSYILVLAGSAIIIREFIMVRNIYQRQAFWMLGGALIPLLINVVYIFRVIPGLTKDFSAIGFAIATFAFGVGILRHNLFDLVPVARSTLVEQMKNGVIVLDNHQRIVDINPAGMELFPQTYQVGDQFSLIDFNKDQPSREINIVKDQEQRSYDVNCISLKDRSGNLMGTLLTLHDITDRKLLLDQVEQFAITDATTGLFNRHYFYQLARKSFEQAHHQPQNVCVILLDLDHFKLINDQFGHLVGDSVLKQVGQFVKRCLRSEDTLARFGGDEFVIFLPGTSLDQAKMIAERIQTGLSKTKLESGNTSIIAQISIGIACRTAEEKIDVDELLERADIALYQSKNNGRRQMTVWSTKLNYPDWVNKG